MPGRVVLSVCLLLGAIAPGFAQQGAATVNGYTAAQRASAEAAAKAAGYTPTRLADVQAGNVFLWAQKDGTEYFLTITPDHKVHVGGVARPSSAVAPAAAR